MLNDSLGELLAFRNHNVVPECVQEFANRVDEERLLVEQYLNSPAHPVVYGFNTLLGPLDDQKTYSSSLRELADGHLVGAVESSPRGLLSLMTQVKIMQISRGGSGLSGDSFRVLLAKGRQDFTAEGAWRASYGSGDVVPAAWWARALFGDDLYRLPAGDFIALVNGNFCSTAAAIAGYQECLDLFANILVLGGQCCSRPRFDDSQAGIAGYLKPLGGTAVAYSAGNVQLPVSVRDLLPVVHASEAALKGLRGAINDRLLTQSGNPLFCFAGETSHVSQSSFLDVRLTMSVNQCLTALSFCVAALVDWVEFLARAAESISERVASVQIPKIARAIQSQIAVVMGDVSVPVVRESGGVEDLADGSLLKAHALVSACSLAQQIVDEARCLFGIDAEEMRDQVQSVSMAFARAH